MRQSLLLPTLLIVSLFLGCGGGAPGAKKKAPAKKAVAASTKKNQAKAPKSTAKSPPATAQDEGTKFPLPPAVNEETPPVPTSQLENNASPRTTLPSGNVPPRDPSATPTAEEFQRALMAITLPGEAEVAPENRASLDFISDEFSGAIFIRVQQALKSPHLAVPVAKQLAAAGALEYGIKLDDLREIVVLVPDQAAKPPQPLALIVRLTQPPADSEKVLSAIGGKVTLKEHEGHRYSENVVGLACLAADETTFLYGSTAAVLRMAGAKGVQSPLTDLLARTDVSKDLTGVFVVTDEFRAGLRGAAERLEKGEGPKFKAPPQIMAGDRAVADGGKFAVFHLNLSGDVVFEAALQVETPEQALAAAQGIQQLLPFLRAEYRDFPFEIFPGAREEVNALANQLLVGLSTRLMCSAQGNQTRGVVFQPKPFAEVVKNRLAFATPEGQFIGRANDMKQFGVGFHTHLDTWRSWPISKSCPKEWFDKDGKPKLSWRVHTLPQMEQQPLYDKFHLDEPWDSAHNLKLAEYMPPYLKRPGLGLKTPILLYTGPGTFQEGGGASMDCKDGFENTILVVEAGDDKAVFWTKPEDLTFDPKDPIAALGTLKDDFILATFADGKVLKLRKDIPADKFTAMLTRSGGEKVNCLDFTLDAGAPRPESTPSPETPPPTSKPAGEETPALAPWEKRVDARPQTVLPAGKQRQIRWLQWSSDSKEIRISTDSSYQLVTLADEKARSFGPAESGISKIFASSPSANFLAEAIDYGHKDIEIRSLGDFQLQKKLLVESEIESMACSADGKILAVGLKDGKITLFDTKTWEPSGTLEGHQKEVQHLAFSPRGRLVSFGGDQNTGRLWDIAGKKTIHEPKLTPLGSFSPPPVFLEERLVAAGTQEGQILTPGQPEADVKFEASPESVLAPSPNGKYVALVTYGGLLRLFDAGTGKELTRVQAVDDDELGTDKFPLAFSPDSKSIAVGGRFLRWFSVAKLLAGSPEYRLAGDEKQSLVARYPRAVCFAAKGKALIGGSSTGQVTVWSVPAFKELQSFSTHEDLRSLAIAPDDKTLALLCGRSYVTIYDLGKKSVSMELKELELSFDGPSPIVYLKNGKLVFTTGKTAVEFDPKTGARVRELKLEGKEIQQLDVTRDGKWMVTGPHYGHMLDVWDFSSGKSNQTIDSIGDVRCLAFSPNGKQLAVAAFTAGTYIFDTDGFKQLHALNEPSMGDSEEVAYSPDSHILAEGRDSVLVFRDAATGREIERYTGHTGKISCIAFSPDGKLLATSGHDETIKIWDVPSLK